MIPGFYETTYQATFQAKPQQHRTFEPPKTYNSIYAINSSSPFDVLPPESFPEKRNDYGANIPKITPKIVKANVEQSGFWAQTKLNKNTFLNQDSSDSMKTTSQEAYCPPRRLDLLSHLKEAQKFSLKTETPFGREPILIESNDPLPNQSHEHSQYRYYPRQETQIPSNTVMEPTGFQRSANFDRNTNYRPTKLTEAEIRKFKQSDPVEYRSIRSGEDKMMYVSQMFYQNPHQYQRRN